MPVFGINLDARNLCARLREPDSRITSQGPDFKHGPGVDESALESEILALEVGNGDCGQAVGRGVGPCMVELAVWSEQAGVRLGVDPAGLVE